MLLVEAHTMFIVMRVSGRLEDRHVHCQESKWKARRQACSMFIVRRVSGRLEDRHVHCQESKWKARRQPCSLSGE
jgi:hypothetical protein